ncbi:GNAT family N-acetyltransferase [Enterococcus ureasiticus]|uniref:GNAT family N-acetyltransferase n=1 Tax=Enterococcus ureasiticus TaxID=903984 RepID=A0A1E5GNU8_9ENTE|nr:GNAT family N-acetyltransferase [Enterococcus ureasiticus]OEG14275.1 GNAT family N-acetyltransferase [Enterococcus ureasiticus]
MIETQRLIIRKIEETEADLKALYTILSDEDVNKYLPWYPVKDIEETKKFYKKTIDVNYQKNDGYYFLICLKENALPIGYIAVSGSENHDFGYGLQKAYWGKGLITEASEAVVHFLKAQGWAYITATHDIHNIGSGKVMQKIGMEYKYSYKEQWQPKDISVTFRMYQLNLDEDKKRVYMEYWDRYPEHFIEEGI